MRAFIGPNETLRDFISGKNLPELIVATLPSVAHPLIILRLLNHRLFGSLYGKRRRSSRRHTRVRQLGGGILSGNHGELYNMEQQQQQPSPQLTQLQQPQHRTLEEVRRPDSASSIECSIAASVVHNNTPEPAAPVPAESSPVPPIDVRSLMPGESETCARQERRKSFSHLEYEKAEAKGYNVVCPWENPNSDCIDNVNLEDDESKDLFEEEDERYIALMESQKENRKFFRWRPSLRKRYTSNKSMSEDRLENSDSRHENSVCSPISPTDTIGQDLLALQRELTNLPNLDASQVRAGRHVAAILESVTYEASLSCWY